jgi:GcrA cell cycle regulator
MPIASSDGGWTDALIQLLRTLWAEGHSTAEIGRRLGVSKNAVVGKAHRLHLPARPSPIGKRPEGQARQPRPPPCPPLPPLACLADKLAPSPAPAAPPRAAHRPRRDPWIIGKQPCCWPMGEPGQAGFRSCSAPAIANKPYCPEHHGVAYRKKWRKQPADETGPAHLASRGQLPGRLCIDLTHEQ